MRQIAANHPMYYYWHGIIGCKPSGATRIDCMGSGSTLDCVGYLVRSTIGCGSLPDDPSSLHWEWCHHSHGILFPSSNKSYSSGQTICQPNENNLGHWLLILILVATLVLVLVRSHLTTAANQTKAASMPTVGDSSTPIVASMTTADDGSTTPQTIEMDQATMVHKVPT